MSEMSNVTILTLIRLFGLFLSFSGLIYFKIPTRRHTTLSWRTSAYTVIAEIGQALLKLNWAEVALFLLSLTILHIF